MRYYDCDFAPVGGIYRSIDSGSSWAETSAGVQDWGDITSSSDGINLAAAVRNGIINHIVIIFLP